MHSGKLVFAQLMAYLPRPTFQRAVGRYRDQFKVKSFSCLDQFLVLAFALQPANDAADQRLHEVLPSFSARVPR